MPGVLPGCFALLPHCLGKGAADALTWGKREVGRVPGFGVWALVCPLGAAGSYRFGGDRVHGTEWSSATSV